MPNSGTATPAEKISSQFKIYLMKFRSGKFFSFLQKWLEHHTQVDWVQTLEITTKTSEAPQAQVTQ
jgi:hypothetical protein